MGTIICLVFCAIMGFVMPMLVDKIGVAIVEKKNAEKISGLVILLSYAVLILSLVISGRAISLNEKDTHAKIQAIESRLEKVETNQQLDKIDTLFVFKKFESEDKL